MKKVIIPSSVEKIMEFAFYCCTGLEYLYIPNSVTEIELGAFSECEQLKTKIIPKRFKNKYIFN